MVSKNIYNNFSFSIHFTYQKFVNELYFKNIVFAFKRDYIKGNEPSVIEKQNYLANK